MLANKLKNGSYGGRTSAANDVGELVLGSTYLGAAAFYGLLIAILLFAIPYGTVEVWHKSLLVLVICVLGGIRLIDAISHGSFRIAEGALLLPLVGVLFLHYPDCAVAGQKRRH